MQIALGPVLIATYGWAASETGHAYIRARELCGQIGETPQLFPVLWGLWAFYLVRADHQTSHELGKHLLSIAQSIQNPALLVEAHFAVGITLSFLGEVALAQAHLEQGIALYDPQQHHSLAFRYGSLDPGVSSLTFVAQLLWCLGYPDQALKKVHEALTLAQEVSHSFSLAYALHHIAILHQRYREAQVAQERAEMLSVLSREQGFSFWLAGGTILRGWALAEQGQGEEGIAQMRQGLDTWQATGAELWLPYYLALLAEMYGKGGQTEEGLTVVAEALAQVDKTGERWHEAELYRLKGEILLAQEIKSQKSKSKSRKSENTNATSQTLEPQLEAEACFLKALEVARRQQAKSLELRAAMSLVRLRQQQALEHGAGSKEQGARSKESGVRSKEQEVHTRLDEAHSMLTEVYNWFTEGFDTKDLQEAKELLEGLEGKKVKRQSKRWKKA